MRLTPASRRAANLLQLHTLGKLAHKPNTPQTRTPVPQTTSANRIFVRTPGSAAAARTPTAGTSTHRVPRRGQPTTPHAIRALQQRRNAALTPGGGRRRSGRIQRETPRDDLRQLSRGVYINPIRQEARELYKAFGNSFLFQPWTAPQD